MKKITQLSLAALLAFNLAACDNANKTSSNTETAKKAEVQLSPQEQFRYDYEKFDKWYSESEKEMNEQFKSIEEKMAKLQSNNGSMTSEDIDKLFIPFTEKSNKALQELDTLNFKDPELINYATLVKQAYQGGIETLPLMLKMALEPGKALQDISKIEAKFNAFEKVQQDMEKEKVRLKQKYEQK